MYFINKVHGLQETRDQLQTREALQQLTRQPRPSSWFTGGWMGTHDNTGAKTVEPCCCSTEDLGTSGSISPSFAFPAFVWSGQQNSRTLFILPESTVMTIKLTPRARDVLPSLLRPLFNVFCNMPAARLQCILAMCFCLDGIQAC